jgi:hypothetical protein
MDKRVMAHLSTDFVRSEAGRDTRAKIEALLDKANGEVLADLWQELFPCPADELPERRAIIEDLADFAEVLRPRLADMGADQLCWLIEKYAGKRSRSRSFVQSLIWGVDGPATVDAQSGPSILRLANTDSSPELPHWDRQARVLRLGDQVVKRFRQSPSNQEAVLSAFEEEGWPPRIDDPLPSRQGQDSVRRLNLTIWRLNKHQRNHLLRFFSDDTGAGICWEPLPAGTGTKFRRAP